jgi:hypothetical protein
LLVLRSDIYRNKIVESAVWQTVRVSGLEPVSMDKKYLDP